MKIHFLGHAAFSLDDGLGRLCLDPHRPGAVGGRFDLPPISGPFDAVAISHAHEDHAGWTPALGTKRIVDRDAQVAGFKLTFRAVPHDQCGGTAMGFSRMIKVQSAALTVVHCGDIGAWDEDDLAWLRGVDLLLVPVGGTFTIDGRTAAALVELVQPRWVMPMHAADPRVDLALQPVQRFVDACPRPVQHLAFFDGEAPPPDNTTLLLRGP